MRLSRWIVVLAFGCLAAVLWYFAGPSLRADESVEREFHLSSDPTVEVLKVRHFGRSGRAHVFTLYSKGRLLYQVTDQLEEVILKQEEVELSEAETIEILETAVDGGLMEFDSDTVEERMRELGRPHVVADGGTLFVDISLDFYRSSDRADSGSASHAFSVQAPADRAQRYPQIREFQAIVDVSRQLRTAVQGGGS